jgi:acyl-CoA thioesterase I
VNAFATFEKGVRVIPMMIKGFKKIIFSFSVVGLWSALLVHTAFASSISQVLMLGDSLTAGYNLPASAALPLVIERKLKEQGHQIQIMNGGVSGDTAAQGLARLEWALTPQTQGVIVALGANDMLRGFAPSQTKRDLLQIVRKLKARQLRVMLVGMKATPSLGADYVTEYDRLFGDIAREEGLILYPFLLNGVTGEPALNQPDGLHPTAKGIEVIADRMLPDVKAFLQ